MWKQAFWRRIASPFCLAVHEAPALFFPGSGFARTTPGIAALIYALTASLQNAPQVNIYTLLKKRIMDPIKIVESEWSIANGPAQQLDGLTLYPVGSGALYSMRAVAKVGRLMLRKGNWDGVQLSQSHWVNRMLNSIGRQSG